jgi:hypothetical protein
MNTYLYTLYRIEIGWCPESDLNRRPTAYEAVALPLSYRGEPVQPARAYLSHCGGAAKPSAQDRGSKRGRSPAPAPFGAGSINSVPTVA